jgi:hypothetical protein
MDQERRAYRDVYVDITILARKRISIDFALTIQDSSLRLEACLIDPYLLFFRSTIFQTYREQ